MPAYNEQAHIEAVIREHIDIDRTGSVIHWMTGKSFVSTMAARTALLKSFDRLSEHTKKVRLVVHTENKGIHQSLVDLYLNARGTHIYFTGSDGAVAG